jgi:tartrate/fumarate subfamily iron-sulfur-dependent hydro-lyase beta chain
MKNSKYKIKNQNILKLPLSKDDALSLHIGDMVLISGQMVTGRDKVHKFLFNEKPPPEQIPFNLKGTVLYHCGPIIKKTPLGFRFIAGGPTTSMRVEMYEDQVIDHYGIRGIMGKGGMGDRTLKALKKSGCVYFNTIGGAGAYLADRIKNVAAVWKLEEFGMAEAMWLLDVADFPAIVTMDAHGRSFHAEVEKKSYKEFRKLVGLK